MGQIIQVTDVHLFADVTCRLKGIPTYETFRDICEHIQQNSPFDWMILTGDLAHDESEAAYLQIRMKIEPWLNRCRIIPGNHDDRELMRKVFPELCDAEKPWIIFSMECDGWRLIGLDSHESGNVSGWIDSEQLEWLASELTRHAHQPTILFVHHPPLRLGIHWLDEIGLANSAEFAALVRRFPNVRAVCTGHVHQSFHGRMGDAEVFSTPSTCVQFSSANEKSRYASLAPGYRILQLDGPKLTTKVVRLPEMKYKPLIESV